MKNEASFVLKGAIVEITFDIFYERFPDSSEVSSQILDFINESIDKSDITDSFFDNALVDEALFILLIPYITIDYYIGEGKFIGVYDLLKSYNYALSSDEIKKIGELLVFVLLGDPRYKPLDLPLFIAKTFGSSEIKISEVYLDTMEKFLKPAAIEINKALPKSDQLSDIDISLLFNKQPKEAEPDSDIITMNKLLDDSKKYSEKLNVSAFKELTGLAESDNAELYFRLYVPPEDNTKEFNADLKKKMAFGILAIGITTAALVFFLRRDKSKSSALVV